MTEPNKLEICQVKLFQFENSDLPVVADCSAWLLCELIPEPHIQQAHDLFIERLLQPMQIIGFSVRAAGTLKMQMKSGEPFIM